MENIWLLLKKANDLLGPFFLPFTVLGMIAYAIKHQSSFMELRVWLAWYLIGTRARHTLYYAKLHKSPLSKHVQLVRHHSMSPDYAKKHVFYEPWHKINDSIKIHVCEVACLLAYRKDQDSSVKPKIWQESCTLKVIRKSKHHKACKYCVRYKPMSPIAYFWQCAKEMFAATR